MGLMGLTYKTTNPLEKKLDNNERKRVTCYVHYLVALTNIV